MVNTGRDWAYCGALFLVLTVPVDGQRIGRPINLKHLETQNLEFLFSANFRIYANLTAEAGQQFVDDLAVRWAVVLPKEKLTVSMGRNVVGIPSSHLHSPDWLKASFDKNHNRVEMRVSHPSKFSIEQVGPVLRHAIVHALLNQEKVAPLPLFLEEGLARYYAGELGSRDRFLAILAFQHYDNLLLLPNNDGDDDSFPYTGALGKLFIDYLWEIDPNGEQAFLQGILKGVAWEEALSLAGYRDWDSLVSDFDFYIRPQHGLYTLVYSGDFWRILLGSLSLLWMGWQVLRSLRAARMVELRIRPAVDTVAPELFMGPAFGGAEPEHPIQLGDRMLGSPTLGPPPVLDSSRDTRPPGQRIRLPIEATNAPIPKASKHKAPPKVAKFKAPPKVAKAPIPPMPPSHNLRPVHNQSDITPPAITPGHEVHGELFRNESFESLNDQMNEAFRQLEAQETSPPESSDPGSPREGPQVRDLD